MTAASQQDLAVIMARGASRRMGRPKGLCRLSDQSQPFLPTLVKVYRDLGLSVLIVTNRQDEAAYRSVIASDTGVAWCAAHAAGDTAETARLAWQASPEAGRYWLQPVDMPLLQSNTLTILQTATGSLPERIVRPVYRGQPGHPVVVPGRVLRVLLEQPDPDAGPVLGPLRDLIKQAITAGGIEPPLTVDVDDPGAVTDFDEPHELR